jgi:putative transcriptional regulator
MMHRGAIARVLGACAVFLLAFGARAQDLDRPLMLVAAPDLEGPYMHTALIVVPVGGDKHLGFILNRASQVKLSALFPQHAPAAKVADPVYFGGPEMMTAIFAVVRRHPGEHSMRLFGDLYVTGDATTIDRIIEQTPNEARFFAGFVGWEEGELADEIEAGVWYVADPDAGQVFSKDSGDAMWGELVKRHGHAAPGLQTRLGEAHVR